MRDKKSLPSLGRKIYEKIYEKRRLHTYGRIFPLSNLQVLAFENNKVWQRKMRKLRIALIFARICRFLPCRCTITWRKKIAGNNCNNLLNSLIKNKKDLAF
jgi:hypothetical protein